ncbi:hypothetical protein GQ43DRAFT_214419 [Delitschia confertaspora ATCC 74209]|uniref:Uncharacterized protein n=1 Tax=Delitschia confertaspora ATCC 74209 TaxID=1513339 RepID=A0A9P4JD79_9PLEO|nr:hypothetical protein GQ43DRAFT_214419 [Delitschia confertaspora ATCC 74209]
MPTKFPSCKRICLSIFLITIVTIIYIILSARIAFRSINTIEIPYFKELERLQNLEPRYRPWKKKKDELGALLDGNRPSPVPWNNRLLPLIHDLTQLRSWQWKQQLNLYDDLTAEYPSQEFWIYVGGTARDTVMADVGESSPLKGNQRIGHFSCAETARICNTYNSAFNQLIENFHTHRVNTTSRASLTFVDCDVSPTLCKPGPLEHGLGLDAELGPVMLVHMRTSSPCRMKMNPLRWYCTTKWEFLPLPLRQMPFTRTTRFVAGGPALPVFPSAFEQLRSVVGFDGAWMGVGLEEEDMVVMEPPEREENRGS